MAKKNSRAADYAVYLLVRAVVSIVEGIKEETQEDAA